MQLGRHLPELLSRRRCCRRELRVFFAEAKTQPWHLDFGSGREELSLRSQQSVVPLQQLTDQLLPGSQMLPRQSQSVRDQASRNGTFGVEYWPALRGANAVFLELSVETIWRLLALLPSIEIACQILHVDVNGGCSEHTGVDAELENVSKHVRGDHQLGCVERVDDDVLDAQASRVPE